MSWKKALVIAAIIFLLVLVGLRVYVYSSVLAGNDVLVRINAQREHFAFINGGSSNVTIQLSIDALPYCPAACTLRFEDVSNNRTLAVENLTLVGGTSAKRSYLIKAPDTGEGTLAYRATASCHQTSWCALDGDITTRSELITATHELAPIEYLLKKEGGGLLNAIHVDYEQQKTQIASLREAFYKIEPSTQSPPHEQALKSLEIRLASNEQALNFALATWNLSDFYSVSAQVETLTEQASNLQRDIDIEQDSLGVLIERHNGIIEKFNENKAYLLNLTKHPTTSRELQKMVQTEIENYNNNLLAAEKATIEAKEVTASKFDSDNLSLIERFFRGESVREEIFLDIESNLFCEISDRCFPRATAFDRINQSEFNMNSTCNRAVALRAFENESSNSSQMLNDSDLSDEVFKLIRLRNNAMAKYLDKFTPEGLNSAAFSFFYSKLSGPPINTTNLTTNKKLLTSAFIITELYDSCATLPLNYSNLSSYNAEPIEINYTPPAVDPISLSETTRQCCTFGECAVCCADESCRSSPQKYPVVLIHGHAVNRELEAEFSLDVFTNMQQHLESDGYLNAGAISLYTGAVPYGAWGELPRPITIEASYYFDTLVQNEGLLYVPTKTENIDTYAIRLRDIISTVRARTGSPRVILVGYSMGGLVARRYLSIFGSTDVDKLILIGTPNHGINGDIDKYCPWVGASRECKDMSPGSLLLKKLNQEPLPAIPITNIIGSGCRMDGEDGDGIVLYRSAQLDGARNIVVNGTCESINRPLHTRLVNPNRMPAVYQTILEAIRSP